MEKNERSGGALTDAQRSIPCMIENGEPIDRAVRRGVREALLEHKRAGNPVAVWRDEKVVWLAPDEILIEADGEDE